MDSFKINFIILITILAFFGCNNKAKETLSIYKEKKLNLITKTPSKLKTFSNLKPTTQKFKKNNSNNNNSNLCLPSQKNFIALILFYSLIYFIFFEVSNNNHFYLLPQTYNNSHFNYVIDIEDNFFQKCNNLANRKNYLIPKKNKIQFKGYTNVDPINKTIIYKCSKKFLILGNALGIYWHGRALAYWNDNYDYKIIGADHFNNFNNSLLAYYSSQICTDYEYNNYTKTNLLRNGINMDTNILHNIPFPQETKELFVFYNTEFIKIIKYETNFIFKKYFEAKNITITHSNLSLCDIVIHIRCGDLSDSKEKKYYFNTLNYYLDAINKLLKPKKNKCLKNPKIIIISQISQNGIHLSHEIKYLDNCKTIAENILIGLKNNYPNYDVILENNPIEQDFYLLTIAPNLICGSSSFCLQGALANLYDNIVLPSKSFWPNLAWAKNKSIIPEKHLIIDTNNYTNKSISCFEIKKRGWNKNIKKLVEYLISH